MRRVLIFAVIVIAILVPVVFLFWPGTDFERYIISTIIVIVVAGAAAYSRRGPQIEKASPIPTDAKVLIICPFCGAKTEQGLLKCRNCGADL